MSALRLTSFARSSHGSRALSFRVPPKPTNYRAFRTSTPTSASLQITPKSLPSVKHTSLQISPKFYVNRPAQFHTTKIFKQDAKEQTAPKQENGNQTGNAKTEEPQNKQEKSDPNAAKIQELEEQVEEYKTKLQYSLAERENILLFFSSTGNF